MESLTEKLIECIENCGEIENKSINAIETAKNTHGRIKVDTIIIYIQILWERNKQQNNLGLKKIKW